jgi:hypothetical protein
MPAANFGGRAIDAVDAEHRRELRSSILTGDVFSAVG